MRIGERNNSLRRGLERRWRRTWACRKVGALTIEEERGPRPSLEAVGVAWSGGAVPLRRYPLPRRNLGRFLLFVFVLFCFVLKVVVDVCSIRNLIGIAYVLVVVGWG